MRSNKIARAFSAATTVILVCAPAGAQQTTGVPGSPDATTTIDGRYLPPPPPKFGGEINPDALQSKPYWPARVVPPKGAPNILLIMTDDTGFGAGSTFGGVIPMPTHRLASMGLRYTNMNSTALCSPSRAALTATRVVVPKPSLAAGRNVFTYSGEVTSIPPGDAPSLLNTSYAITADVEIPPGGAEGMLNTNGGRFGGYGFYLSRGKPVFTWNLLDLKRVRWEGPEALSPGKHTLEFDLRYDGLGFATLAFNNLSGIGRSGTGVLKVDGKVVSTQTMERTVPIILQFDETFYVGADTGTPVDDGDYQVPFRFTGKLNKLTLRIERPKLTAEDEKRLREGAAKAADQR